MKKQVEKQSRSEVSNKTVMVFGTFDRLHDGHRYFLSQARKLGEHLTIVVARDSVVRALKGRQPTQLLTPRMRSAKLEKLANRVVAGDSRLSTWSVIKKYRPEIIALGHDQEQLAKALKQIASKFKFLRQIKVLKAHPNKRLHSRFFQDQKIPERCVFCSKPEIRARAIFSNSKVLAFPTNIPIVPGHLLLIPSRCVQTWSELTQTERQAIEVARRKIIGALTKTFKAEGFNYAWNEGKLAGQGVGHLHLHIIPRKQGDTGITKYDPRKFLYRPGSRETTPENELEAVAKSIRKNL